MEIKPEQSNETEAGTFLRARQEFEKFDKVDKLDKLELEIHLESSDIADTKGKGEVIKKDKDRPSYRIGVDVGGTKAAVGLVASVGAEFKVLDSLIMPTFLKREIHRISNEREHAEEELLHCEEARDCFLQRLASLISQIVCLHNHEVIEPWIGIGTCGYIVDGHIVPETAPMLGPAFSNFSFLDWGMDLLQELFKNKKLTETESHQVYVHNDALAQMACGVHLLLQEDKKKLAKKGQGKSEGGLSNGHFLLNNKVAYIGPGTGLGGGFALVDGEGKMQFFTNGHIGDLILGEDPETGAKLCAEDHYLSGYYIEKELGISGLELGENWEKHIPFIKKLGQNLGKIIECIYRGEVYKNRPVTDWSDEDRQAVKGTKVYVLGGSLATKGELGKLIREEATHYLQEHLQLLEADKKIVNSVITLLPIPELSEHAGIIGATLFN